MKFEIINPSDPYTIECADMLIAAVACVILGAGKYAFRGIGPDAGREVPLFLFGGHDEWFRCKFNVDTSSAMASVMRDRREEFAAALDSVTLLAEQRSSTNDIGGTAKRLAAKLRQGGES